MLIVYLILDWDKILYLLRVLYENCNFTDIHEILFLKIYKIYNRMTELLTYFSWTYSPIFSFMSNIELFI